MSWRGSTSGRGLLLAAILGGAQARAQHAPPPAPARGATGAPPSAAAKPPPRWDQPLTLLGHVSFGGPQGLAGGVLDVAPTSWLVVGAGAGGNLWGAAFALSPRARATNGAFALGAGVGLSTSPYDTKCNPILSPCAAVAKATNHWQRALWVNPEITLEGRPGVFTWRAYLGWAQLLNPKSSGCVGPGGSSGRCPEYLSLGLPYLGAGFGVVLWEPRHRAHGVER